MARRSIEVVGNTFDLKKDTSRNWTDRGDGPNMAVIMEIAAKDALEKVFYGNRSAKRMRRNPVCPACGLVRSNTGLCDCNS